MINFSTLISLSEVEGPGGLFDINELTATYASSDPVVDVFVNQLLTNYFTFIPSISAMDYFTNNWYEYMGIPDRTPFDAWSMPTINEPHVQLTPENVEFALNEIFQGEGKYGPYVKIMEDEKWKYAPLKDDARFISKTFLLSRFDVDCIFFVLAFPFAS